MREATLSHLHPDYAVPSLSMPNIIPTTRVARVPHPDSENLTSSDSDGRDGTPKRSRRRNVANKHLESVANGDANGFLKVPDQARRHADRSPSPLGLIPIHTKFRSFIHRHEVPRKALHVSVGFLTLSLYANGYETSQIHPVLLSALIPITAVDVLRHNFPTLNRLYVQVVGALMRESEVDGYNGVIWYLAGTWAALRFFPKDVGVVSVLLLSWCDTAASTVGRLWGRNTWQIRRGKSVAGSAAALVVGGLTAWGFWGWATSRAGASGGLGGLTDAFAFRGSLGLPSTVKQLLGWPEDAATITGAAAIGVMSIWSGVVASVSEAVDVFGLDDNFTIPVLCGVGIWGFLRVFGNA